MKGIIYCYCSITSGKKYIGQTIHEQHRKNQHRHDSNRGVDNKFYRAVKKYGWDDFIYGVIEECSESDLNEREKHYINLYDTYNVGYNANVGGDGQRGFTFSQASREKMASKKRGWTPPNKKYFTEEEWRKAKREADRRYRAKRKLAQGD